MDVDMTDKMQERDDEIEKLFKIVDIIIDLLGEELGKAIKDELTAWRINIDISDEISGVLMTVFTCLRKQEHDPTGHLKYLGYTAQISGVSIGIQTIVEKIIEKKISINFMVATPIVELMTLFKGMFDEVRTGVTRFRVRASVARRTTKRDSSGKVMGWNDPKKDVTQNISQYGLSNHHVPLLQGVTLAPERRTGVIRSLGPLTQAILLIMEEKYFNKISAALLHSLQMLPMATEIINCLRDARNPGNVAGIIKELGDILLLTTARSTQKIFFPLLLLYKLWNSGHANYKWSFSGSDMLKTYSLVIKKGLRFRIRTGGDPIKTAQVVFHAMFGTYLDDLEILSQITTHSGKWLQRKDMNSVFLKRGEKAPVVFAPIGFKYVSKMAQALLTKSLGNVDPVTTSRPSFSGYRKRTFTQEFLAYLSTGKSAQNFSSDPVQLQYALKKVKDQLLEDRESTKLLNAGTTTWETYEDKSWVEKPTFIPIEGSTKFFGV